MKTNMRHSNHFRRCDCIDDAEWGGSCVLAESRQCQTLDSYVELL